MQVELNSMIPTKTGNKRHNPSDTITQRLEGRCIEQYATSESLRPNPKSVWPHNFFQPLNSLFAAWTLENYCGH